MSNSLFLSLWCSMYSVYITCVCDKLRRIGTVVERAQILTEGWWLDSRQSFSRPFLAYMSSGGPKMVIPNSVTVAQIVSEWVLLPAGMLKKQFQVKFWQKLSI